MDAQSIPLRTTGIRFVRAIKTFAQSDVGWKAKLIFAALVLLLCAANALNVVNSYVGRNFMTAIADRNMPGFVRQAFIYIGVFAALTLVAVIARFGEERLGLLWRHDDSRNLAPLPRRRNLSTPQRFGSDRKPRPAHLRRRTSFHGHDSFLRAHGAQ